MNKKSFQILILQQEKRNDTQAFELLEEMIKDLFIPVPAKKKILSIWMELYQNLMKFRSPEHLALFRLEVSNTGFVKMISMNFSRNFYLDVLEKKFYTLKNSLDLKGDFQEKLQNKMESKVEKAGDFGLDFCFRYSTFQRFERIKQIENEDIVYLSFSFNSYE
jgi:hypothetical protein